MMQTFKTLLLREWMQHQRGWWILTLAPLAILLAAMGFGDVQLDGDEAPAGLFVIFGFAYATAVAGLAAVSVIFQSSGLARRDQQDRSIEFWLSLPVGHWSSIGATLLSHFWLFPLMAMLLGLAGGLLVAPLFVLRGFGATALLHLPWAELMLPVAVGVLRLLVGVLVAMSWLAPLMLLVMAASAWLKRWGVPVVLATVGLGGLLLEHYYGLPQVHQVLSSLVEQAAHAALPGLRDPDGSDAERLVAGQLDGLAHWLMVDLGQTLGQLASPLFLGAVAFSLGCVWLMVLRRERG